MNSDQPPSHKVFGIPHRIFVPAAALIIAVATIVAIRHSFAPRDEAEDISPAKQRLVKRDISKLRQAVFEDPHSWEAHYRLGRALASAGREGEAIDHLKRAAEINGQERRAHWELGRAYDRIGLYDDALESYRQVLRIDPGAEEARQELVRVEQRKMEAAEAGVYSGIAGFIPPPSAMTQPAPAPAVEPESPPAVRIESGAEEPAARPEETPTEDTEAAAPPVAAEDEEALPDEAALESMLPPEGVMDPLLFSEDSVEINVELGILYNSIGQFIMGAQLFSKALDKEPDNPPANFGLGISYLGLGNRQAATAQYLILIALDPVLANRLLAEINK